MYRVHLESVVSLDVLEGSKNQPLSFNVVLVPSSKG